MDEKTLTTLEFPKVLEKLAAYAAFSASAELARALAPTDDIDQARQRLAEVTEARFLLSVNDQVTIGGAHDIRPLADLAARGGVLSPPELLDIKATLLSSRTLARTFEKNKLQYPRLAFIAAALPDGRELIDTISRAITDRAEIADYASDKLASIRREVKIAHERLLARLERIVNDPKNAPILQESIITQRGGRYVIPLRAEFKGRVRSIIHDQSASGATLFVEPLVVVEQNNRWRELQLAERDEERRILAEISARVGDLAPQLHAAVDALAQIDFALMRAKYAEDLRAAEVILQPIRPPQKEHHPGSTVILYQARHPLLDPATVVPLDIQLDPETYALIITGPNTGGKTVTLKTVGLMAAMSQAGLHIPAQSGSELSIFKNIFADIGDEQSIEQSLSTFSGHIRNIVRILRLADSKCLVLLDELGAGTDPQEGAALARAILQHLLERRVTTFIATHYPELKAYAHATPGVVNASVEFDLKTLRPTYHLTVGLPGRSNALAIATRLGLPKEIIEAARGTLDPASLQAEDLLNEIHHQREVARKARSAADRARSEAERYRAELAARLDKIEDERRKVLEAAQSEAEDKVRTLETELEQVRKALQRARQPLDALAPLVEQVEELQEETAKPVVRRRHALQARRGPLQLGEKIRLRTLGAEGVITALTENDAEVQVGNLRVRARLDDLERKGIEAPAEVAAPQPARTAAQSAPAPAQGGVTFRPSPGIELDLRGQRAEDALDMLERYLENAYLAGLPFVRIIHGKGTGKLRDVIRQELRSHAHVASFESGQDKEGGDGVTVAKLRKE